MTDEAMVEAVARAICRSDGPSPDGLRPDGSPMWTFYQVDAIAAIRAVTPLLIEQCAEVAGRDVDWVRFGTGAIEQWDGGPDAVRDYRLGIAAGRAIAAAIRALAAEESEPCAPAGVTSRPR